MAGGVGECDESGVGRGAQSGAGAEWELDRDARTAHGGNLSSRFTDFLTADGEKPWRDRDGEFADGELTRREVEEVWTRGLSTAERALRELSDSDLEKTVKIRGQSLTVHAALCRSVAHFANHAGQIILLARIVATGDWKWLTIPKGQSKQYNQNPTMEKAPAAR